MNCGKQGRKFFVTAFLGFFVFSSLFAQQQTGSNTRRIGLFVGANEGNYKQPMLRFAQSDAEAVSKIFSELGGISGNDNILLPQPSPAYLRYRLDEIKDELANAKRNGQRTELIFYYAGHSDGKNLNLGSQPYPTFALLERIQNIEADVRIVILDMCYAGDAARGEEESVPISFDGCTVLTSTKANEQSWENREINSTYFTSSLITGLRGAADINGDANVSLKELYDFVDKQVKIKIDNQNPQFNPKNTGSEETVLTNTRRARARFIINSDVTGRISIWDDSREICVSEVIKENQGTMELAFEFGNYQLRLYRENPSRWLSQRLRENNSNIRLQMKDFFPGGIAGFWSNITSRGYEGTLNYYEPPPGYSSISSTPSDASAASTQLMPIKEALLYATNKISASILPGSIIAIDNIALNYAELSKYIMNELTTNMDNKGLYTIIPRDKDQLDRINEEVARFLSGNVSDESQISPVGHDLLPDTLITGSIIYTEDTYQLYIRAIDLEGKNIRPNSTYSVSILNDSRMQGLTGNRSNYNPTVSSSASSVQGFSVDLGGGYSLEQHQTNNWTSWTSQSLAVNFSPKFFFNQKIGIGIYGTISFPIKVKLSDTSPYLPTPGSSTYNPNGAIGFDILSGPIFMLYSNEIFSVPLCVGISFGGMQFNVPNFIESTYAIGLGANITGEYHFSLHTYLFLRFKFYYRGYNAPSIGADVPIIGFGNKW